MRRAPQPRQGSGPRPAPAPNQANASGPQGAPRQTRNFNDPFEEFRRKKEQAQAARAQREGGAPARPPQQAPQGYQQQAPQHAPQGYQQQAPQQGYQQQPPPQQAYQQAPQGYQQPPQQPKLQTQRMSPQRGGGGGAGDPFEEFRRKKEQAQLEKQQRAQQQTRAQTGLENIGWIEGIGPAAEVVDPNKPRGFSRGRYERKSIDPNTLRRPAGFEQTKLTRGGVSDHSDAAKNAQKVRGFQRF